MAEMTPRERRAQRAGKARARTTVNWSKAIAPVAVISLLTLVGVMTYAGHVGESKCPGHWHSTFHVYVNGERIDFDQPEFRLAGPTDGGFGTLPLRFHMHNGDRGQQTHWEPSTATCLKFGEFAREIDLELRPGKLTLNGVHDNLGQGYALRDGDDGGKLGAYIADFESDDWREISISKLIGRQPKDCEKILIVFGSETEAELEALQSTVQPPSQCYGQGPLM